MRNAVVLAIAAALGLAGCNASQPKLTQQTVFLHQVGHAGWPGEKTAANCRIPHERPGDDRAFTGTGDREETAIVFDGTMTERTGIGAEYAYVARHLPGWQVCGQGLLTPAGGRLYDQLDLVGPAGERRSIYFDITGWFGRIS
ncbi:hypothetical protein [Inquilinus limosus]|uniref:Lipoprotein n=1 Tax=Inquilinus limosus TaxID=171674 RepID=A0A211ZM64_9PROT|nr:hypothetical protein [Inquilinus limosus]OWJ66266.1 hypothetical protein BWR60_15385 [Inquilinus limosus]